MDLNSMGTCIQTSGNKCKMYIYIYILIIYPIGKFNTITC